MEPKEKHDRCYQECDYCGGWWDESGPFDYPTNISLGISQDGKLARRVCSRCFIFLLDKVIPKAGGTEDEPIGYR